MNISAACNISKLLPTLPIFMTELSFTLLLAPFGFVLNCFLVYGIAKSTLFNINLRILLGHLSILALLFCLTNFGKSVYIGILAAIDPCYLVTSLYYCKVQELATILPLVTMLYSLVAIGIERLYATLRYTTYDSEKNIYLAVFLIIVIWAVALGFQLSPLPQIPQGYIPICQNLLVLNKQAAVTILSFSMTLEILSVMIFTATTLLDRMKLTKLLINKTQHCTLAARFQLSQNIDVNKIMLPSALAHLACFIPQNIFATSAVCGWEMSIETKLQFLTFALLLVLIFTIFHALIIFYKNDRLRQQVTKEFPLIRKLILNSKVKPETQVNNADDTNKYFDFYESMWNNKPSAQDR